MEHEQLDNYISETCLQTEFKTFYCGVCQKPGNKKQDIERHIESVHIQTNPFKCDICGSLLKTRKSLQIHLRRHKNDSIAYE